MERKKWTAKVEITDSIIKFREKRKWQLALRRYVLEKNISASYASYFGLGIDHFRKWIEIQFTEDLNWGNFGSAWQFEHIMPIAYFDFSIEEDLLLCWNFINIKVEKIELNQKRDGHIDIIAVKRYFQALHNKSGYFIYQKMIDKISQLEALNIVDEPAIIDFIISNKEYLAIVSSLTREEFNSLNRGVSLDDILLEREIVRKFG